MRVYCPTCELTLDTDSGRVFCGCPKRKRLSWDGIGWRGPIGKALVWEGGEWVPLSQSDELMPTIAATRRARASRKKGKVGQLYFKRLLEALGFEVIDEGEARGRNSNPDLAVRVGTRTIEAECKFQDRYATIYKLLGQSPDRLALIRADGRNPVLVVEIQPLNAKDNHPRLGAEILRAWLSKARVEDDIGNAP